MLQLLSAGPMLQARVLVSGRHGPVGSLLPLPAILDGIFTSTVPLTSMQHLASLLTSSGISCKRHEWW